MNTVKDKLNKLDDYQAQVDAIHLEYGAMRDALVTQEIRNQWDAMAIEMEAKTEAAAKNIKELTAEIKAEVIKGGETVKSEFLMAVSNKPRVTWDSKGLEGYAVAHPEILSFQKIGNPSCTIRKVKS